MKTVCLLNGSLRGEKAASFAFLNVAAARLLAAGFAVERITLQAGGGGYSSRETLEVMANADAVVVAFPLFSYTLPGGLTAFLEDFSSAVRGGGLHSKRSKVFAIVNCGFPEPWIMKEAIRVVRNFCARLGLDYGFAIAIASGPVTVLTMRAPFLNPRLKKAFAHIVEDCAGDEAGHREDVFLAPLIPKCVVIKIKEYYENKSPSLRHATSRNARSAGRRGPGGDTPAWKSGAFVGYVFLALVVPIAGFLLGRAGVAKGGRRRAQGIALFLIALLSTVVYGVMIPSFLRSLSL